MDAAEVTTSYRRWAPVYDYTFGLVSNRGRRLAIERINQSHGKVLEVGVGTGMALPRYARHLDVTGVDFSHEMLARARAKVTEAGLDHVTELRQMDARALDFPDDSFDTVVAMYLVSVVPEPERVVQQMARVCKPGGQVIIVNHFARDTGLLARLEKAFASAPALIGWHSDFRIERILGASSLRLDDREALPPGGLFTLLRFVKSPADAPQAPASGRQTEMSAG